MNVSLGNQSHPASYAGRAIAARKNFRHVGRSRRLRLLRTVLDAIKWQCCRLIRWPNRSRGHFLGVISRRLFLGSAFCALSLDTVALGPGGNVYDLSRHRSGRHGSRNQYTGGCFGEGSTLPKTTAGKARVTRNAYRGGRRASLRDFARLLRCLSKIET
jgi:hypothetical protein